MLKDNGDGTLTWVEAGATPSQRAYWASTCDPNVRIDGVGATGVVAGGVGKVLGGMARKAGDQLDCAHRAPFANGWSHDITLQAIEEATQAERKRILAALEKIAPPETPFARGSFEMERKAEIRLYAKVLKAIGGTT